MKISTLRTAWEGLIACAVLAACAIVLPQALRDLPELPAEFARDLAVADTAPVLMTKPARSAAPSVPRPSPPPPAPARACTTHYAGYVIYPFTVCYPPSVLYDMLKLAAASETPAASGVTISPPQVFKLTSHPLVSFGSFWYCTVRSGPWYAEVSGAQTCNANPNILSFTAAISGAPEPVFTSWSGTLADVPPPLKLVAISETGQFCTCCSGVTCPNGACAPDSQHCGVGPPAARPRR